MTVSRLACLTAAACLAWQTIPYAQGKGKGPKPEPTDTPAVAWVSTDGRLLSPQDPVDFEDTCTSVIPGAINGDGFGPYVGSGNDISSGSGAFLRQDGEFVLELREGGARYVYVNFLGIYAGSSSPSPRKDFCAVTLEQFHLNTHFLLDDGTDDVSMSLTDIPAGETYPARINSSFVLDGITYQIRFNPVGYAGSTNVKVTRGIDEATTPGLPSDEWWAIETGYGEAGSGEVAQLVSPAITKKGKPGPNDEGFYYLPFKIVFTIDSSEVAQHQN
jgi:hypothetical protein